MGWTSLTSIKGPKGDAGPTGAEGPQGIQGPPGEDGAGIETAGSVAAYGDLPTTLNADDAGSGYLVEADGRLYIWSGTAFPANGQGVLEGCGEIPPVKNSPALGGYGAAAMNAALTASMTKLPEQLRTTLTGDRGKELSSHAQFALETGTKVFFADPHSPWQRPTNENTNGLLRQYFPT